MTSSPTPQKKPWIAIAIVIALTIVAVNLAGYVFFRSRQQPVGSAGANAINVPTKAVAPPTAPEGLTSSAKLAQEQRESGVRALRSADYKRAITLFEAALALDKDVADVPVLLDLAKRLDSGKAQPQTAENTPAKTTPKPPPKRATRVASRSRRRTSQASRRQPKPAKTPDATLLVTTVPEGLLIEVDGRPTELSPARLALRPGRHQVRLRRGPNMLFEESFTFTGGKTLTVKEDFSERLANAPEVKPPPEVATKSGLSEDPNLDLVALLDRNREAPKTAVEAPDPGAPSKGVRPTPSSKPPGLLVYWPGRTGSDIRATLGADFQGIDVKVVSGSNTFKEALQSTPTDAVMATPYVLKQNGLSPALTAALNASNRFLAVSMNSPVSKPELSTVTLGVVDELGKRQTPIFVARLLGVPKAPRLRRVGKLEDLLPLLQFSMAKAVLVRERDFATLKSRTQQTLHQTPLRTKAPPLAVAFVSGGRRSTVERALMGMKEQTRRALGVDSWKR